MSASADKNKSSSDKSKSENLPRIEGSVSVGKTKWLELRTLTYTDQEGTERKWDYATRTTKKSADSADAVVIVPLLKSSKQSSETETEQVFDTILVEQFRPPVGQATLEFPAGLIDDGETAEQAALRELKEETGYVGTTCAKMASSSSRPVCMTPGLADETVQVVAVTVDLDAAENANPQAEPDAGEHIVVHRVSLQDGLQSLLDKGESPMAIMGLYLFAVGLEIGKSINSGK